MLLKEFTAKVKAADGEAAGEGVFTALVSVFGNKDSVGDVVMAGAFTDTIANDFDADNPVPVIYSHDWLDPFSHIGYCTEVIETEEGLQVTGQLDMDNEKAVQIWKLMKGGRLRQFSFAYDILEMEFVEAKDSDGNWEYYYRLIKLKLYEVGPTLVGANQETALLSIKSGSRYINNIPRKAGKVLADKHLQALKDAHEMIAGVIAAAEPAEDDTKTSGAPASKGVPTTGTPTAETGSQVEPTQPAAEGSTEPQPQAKSSSASAQALARLSLAAALAGKG